MKRKKKPARRKSPHLTMLERMESAIAQLSRISTSLEYTARILEELQPQFPHPEDEEVK